MAFRDRGYTGRELQRFQGRYIEFHGRFRGFNLFLEAFQAAKERSRSVQGLSRVFHSLSWAIQGFSRGVRSVSWNLKGFQAFQGISGVFMRFARDFQCVSWRFSFKGGQPRGFRDF